MFSEEADRKSVGRSHEEAFFSPNTLYYYYYFFFLEETRPRVETEGMTLPQPPEGTGQKRRCSRKKWKSEWTKRSLPCLCKDVVQISALQKFCNVEITYEEAILQKRPNIIPSFFFLFRHVENRRKKSEADILHIKLIQKIVYAQIAAFFDIYKMYARLHLLNPI